MTPELQSQLNGLQQQIDAIRNAQDPDYLANNIRFTKAIVDKSGDTTPSNITRSVNEGGASSYTVAKAHDVMLTVTVGDTDYKLGVYNT